MDKEDIRQYVVNLGADVEGFTTIADYCFPLFPEPQKILPNVQSMVVIGYRENNGAVGSSNTCISMASRMGGMA